MLVKKHLFIVFTKKWKDRTFKELNLVNKFKTNPFFQSASKNGTHNLKCKPCFRFVYNDWTHYRMDSIVRNDPWKIRFSCHEKNDSSDSVQFPLLFTHVFHFMFQFIFGLRAEKRSWTVAQEEEKDKGKFRKRMKECIRLK